MAKLTREKNTEVAKFENEVKLLKKDKDQLQVDKLVAQCQRNNAIDKLKSLQQ